MGLRQNTCPKDFGRRCWGGAAGCKLVPLLALALTKGSYFFFAFALQDRPWETAMSLGFGLSIPTGPRVDVDEITVDEIAGKFDDMALYGMDRGGAYYASHEDLVMPVGRQILAQGTQWKLVPKRN